MKETKKYIQAPLPFMGQKRRFLNEFKKALSNYNSESVYVDLFGGSGLLSHTVKKHYPKCQVIYNDYDNYSQRIKNIDKTNSLLSQLRLVLANSPKDKKIEEPYKKQVLSIVKEAQNKGFVDYITLSSSLLFSMKYVLNYEQLSKETMYNCVRLTDYNADGYLDGVTVVCEDYKKLFNQYKDNKNVVFLVDPPYLSTDVGTYKNYWKLKDYLDVLNVLEGTNYFYFTSNKSNIVELCEWISNITNFNPFANATVSTTNNHMNYSSSYTDIMLYKVNYLN
jgi:16S rRNA G966 N2-methylase RsmD